MIGIRQWNKRNRWWRTSKQNLCGSFVQWWPVCYDTPALYSFPAFLEAPLRLSFGGILDFFSLSHVHPFNKMDELIQKKSLLLSFLCPCSPIWFNQKPHGSPNSVGTKCLSAQESLFNMYQKLRRLVVYQSLHIPRTVRLSILAGSLHFHISVWVLLHWVLLILQNRCHWLAQLRSQIYLQSYNKLEIWISYTVILSNKGNVLKYQGWWFCLYVVIDHVIQLTNKEETNLYQTQLPNFILFYFLKIFIKI